MHSGCEARMSRDRARDLSGAYSRNAHPSPFVTVNKGTFSLASLSMSMYHIAKIAVVQSKAHHTELYVSADPCFRFHLALILPTGTPAGSAQPT